MPFIVAKFSSDRLFFFVADSITYRNSVTNLKEQKLEIIYIHWKGKQVKIHDTLL